MPKQIKATIKIKTKTTNAQKIAQAVKRLRIKLSDIFILQRYKKSHCISIDFDSKTFL
jgi:hypothetical protein